MISNIPTLAADQHRQRSQTDMLEAALGEPLTKEQIAAAREPTEDEVQKRIHALCMRVNEEADAACLRRKLAAKLEHEYLLTQQVKPTFASLLGRR